MKILPHEASIIGSWIFDGQRVIADDKCQRIDWLRTNYLELITTDATGWLNLYQDPQDGRYWQLDFEQGELQGGGPPSLKLLTVDEVNKQYNI
jgi:hypothetical protein